MLSRYLAFNWRQQDSVILNSECNRTGKQLGALEILDFAPFTKAQAVSGTGLGKGSFLLLTNT